MVARQLLMHLEQLLVPLDFSVFHWMNVGLIFISIKINLVLSECMNQMCVLKTSFLCIHNNFAGVHL